MKHMIYKVVSGEWCKLKRELSTKREAIALARSQRKSGWTATVFDMRTGKRVDPVTD